MEAGRGPDAAVLDRGRAVRRMGRLSVLAVALLGGGAQAAVTEVSAAGFVIAHELELPGEPARVYAAITDVSAWWDAAHSYSGEAGNFTLDPRAGGCFCEALPDGGSVEHMRVLFAAPGTLLRLSGGLGPLQGLGAGGVMDFALSPADDGHTTLRFRYTVSGYVPGGLEDMAGPVDGVLGGQLARLAAYLEKN